MTSRFGSIKFNLLRAVEIFQDLNDIDLDVLAPPSSPDYYKEKYVAERLNEYLGQLIEEGVFDDCDLRDEVSSEEEEELNDSSQISTPESQGFDYDPNERDQRASKESLAGRIKRYVRRIIPGNSSRSSSSHGLDRMESTSSEMDNDQNTVDRSRSPGRRSSRRARSGRNSGSRRSSSSSSARSSRDDRASRPRSRRSSPADNSNDDRQSGSYQAELSREDSPPYDPQVVHKHQHFHKHNHPNSHHHHKHSGPHIHSYHRHSDESNGGLSDDFRAQSDDDLSSGPLAPRSRSTSRSRSSSISSRRRSSSSRRAR